MENSISTGPSRAFYSPGLPRGEDALPASPLEIGYCFLPRNSNQFPTVTLEIGYCFLPRTPKIDSCYHEGERKADEDSEPPFSRNKYKENRK